MLLQPILALIIIRYLRKSLKTAGLLAKWDRLFMFGMALFIAMIVLSTTVKESRTIITWLGHALLLALVYFVFYQKELKAVKPVMYAVLPVILVYIIEDAMMLVAPGFHDTWKNYIGAAEFASFIWMGVMIYMNNKQQKALEKERIKNEEKEKEYKITETLKVALEVQVKERTTELTLQKEELQQTLNELRSTQSQLIQSEKMASLGELTAGIAHEIQNPLNFVNNFSEVNTELIEELKTEKSKPKTERDDKLEDELLNDIAQNLEKINQHGKRADAIVKGMLQHSRSSSGVKEPTDINKLADEYLRLAYHGLRAKDKSFNATMKTDFDESIGNINIIPQDIGRVILNLITNAFYAVTEKKKQTGNDYEPTVTVSTKKINGKVEVIVKDNGNGIPQKLLEKIFQPFFTTKPTGQGTGLGLSMSYDIITKGHNGELKVKTLSAEAAVQAGKEGEGAEFIINLPA